VRPYLEKKKKGLVECLQVQALSSNPSTAKKKKNPYLCSPHTGVGSSVHYKQIKLFILQREGVISFAWIFTNAE
jgi:hypothetical protein